MKANSLPLLFIFVPLIAGAQTRAGTDFQITKITKNLISTPQFTYGGGEQHPTNQRDRWLEVEVEFAAAPTLTDELTFKYYVLFNGNLLTGEVTHVNIPAGRERRSVMYVLPRAPDYGELLPKHRRANCAARYGERRVESSARPATMVCQHVAGFRIRLEQKRNAVCAPLLGSLRADQGPLKRKFRIRSSRLQRKSNIK